MSAPGRKDESVVENTPVRRIVEHAVVAVDLAKNVFEVAVSEVPGKVAFRRRLKRAELAAFIAQLPPATVLLEACGSAHHWAHVVAGFGHRVVLLPPHKTRRYRAGSKTDTILARGEMLLTRAGDTTAFETYAPKLEAPEDALLAGGVQT